jgi:hypothetical protein
MHPSVHDTIVRSASGRPELRQVTQVHEWRIEQALDSDGFVISIVAPSGESQSFLVAHTDAQDIGEVLRRRAGLQECGLSGAATTSPHPVVRTHLG